MLYEPLTPVVTIVATPGLVAGGGKEWEMARWLAAAEGATIMDTRFPLPRRTRMNDRDERHWLRTTAHD